MELILISCTDFELLIKFGWLNFSVQIGRKVCLWFHKICLSSEQYVNELQTVGNQKHGTYNIVDISTKTSVEVLKNWIKIATRCEDAIVNSYKKVRES